MFFFFSSRRRHTRFDCDWSSDVCSSDLTGYTVLWSGQYESAERARQRLSLAVPITVVLILLLLYFNTRSIAKTAIITLAVPFSAVGAVWMVYLLGYHMSIAVWVGIIALLGIDAETGVYAKQRDEDRKSTRLNSSHSQISYAVFCLKKKKTYMVCLHRPVLSAIYTLRTD